MLSQTIRSRAIERSPVFYGWVIWVVATLGIVATSPGQSFTVSLFIDHYIDEFYGQVNTYLTPFDVLDPLAASEGLGRTIVSSLFSLGTFVAALSLTWVGKQVDRYGNRRVGFVVVVLFSLVLVALSAIMGPLTLFLSFLMIRLFGQGALFLVSSTAIARWWRFRRGWVMGLALVGFALFRWLYLPWLQTTIEAFGWRTTWIILGVAVGVVMIPLWGLFMRDQPEKYGLLPDGAAVPVVGVDDEIEVDEENWTLAEAQRTAIFWVFLFGRFLVGSWMTGLVFHQVSVFEQVGHSAQVAAQTFGYVSLISAGMTMAVGRIIDWLKPNYLLITQLLALIATMLVALVMVEMWMLVMYAACFGLIMGIGGPFDGTVWADLFGRLHHGAIRGFAITGLVIGTSLGPVIFGLSHDLLGSYQPVIFAGVMLVLVEIALCLWVKPPTKS